MAKWFGYGEDALTYWALRNHLDDILAQLRDKSSASERIVFYRPSFGRGGGSNTTNSPRAEFGEFDAIIATPQSIYPVEAKWHASSEVRGLTITIDQVQMKRHSIFAWYLESYAECNSKSNAQPLWDDFVQRYKDAFRKQFPGKKLAPSGSKLAFNIEFVLCQLLSIRQYGNPTKNVLLYFYPRGSQPASSVTPDSFSLVNVSFDTQCKGDIFLLSMRCTKD